LTAPGPAASAARSLRVAVALESQRQLRLVDHGVELARRECLPLEVIVARVRLAPMLHFAPVDRDSLRQEIAEEAHGVLMEAVAMVPADVALTARLVDGKAWAEVERMAKQSPGELLAVRIERRRRRPRRSPFAGDRALVVRL
jgi:hypothetical protein